MHQDHNLLLAISPVSIQWFKVEAPSLSIQTMVLQLQVWQLQNELSPREHIPKPIASEPFMIFSRLHVSMNILQTKTKIQLTIGCKLKRSETTIQLFHSIILLVDNFQVKIVVIISFHHIQIGSITELQYQVRKF